MSEWKEILLGDVIEIINGFAFKSSNFLEAKIDNSLPVIKIKNVANGDVHLNGCQFHAFNKTLDKFVIEKGDVLIALTGNHPEVMTQVVGEASRYKLNDRAFLNQRVAKVLPKENKKVSNDFLYYFLKDDSTHDYLASQSTGSANQANISKIDIENIPITLPPLSEQTAIAEVLCSLDDKIDLLQCQNKTLEQLAETLFKQWFIEEVEGSWDIGKVEDLFTLQRGFDLPSQNRTKGAYPIIASNGINGYHDEYKIKGPGVTTGRSGVLGKVIYTQEDFWPLNTTLFIKEYKIATPLFAYFFLKTLDLETLNAGSAVPTLNRNHVHEMATVIPNHKIVIEFEEIVAINFQKIKSNTQQIHTLTELRDTLLPKLMSGEVRVNDN
jgi:type I restriction enzyme S subunit